MMLRRLRNCFTGSFRFKLLSIFAVAAAAAVVGLGAIWAVAHFKADPNQHLCSQLLAMVTLLVLATMGLTLAGVDRLTKRARNNLSRISDYIDRLRQGQVDEPLVIAGSDETARLAADINSMAGDLQMSLKLLEQYNRNLEEIIEQRTEQLAQRNAELQRANERLQETQIALAHSEKMAALGRLVAGVAHEINNPVAFVCNNLYNIQRDVRELCELLCRYQRIRKLPAERMSDELRQLGKREMDREISELIRELPAKFSDTDEGLNRIKTIVQDLRNYSRLNRARLALFDLNEGIRQTLRIFRSQLDDRIEVKLDLAELPKLACDPAQINQVFTNLISNAVDAIPDRGTITITTRCDDENIYITVADTGCGMDEQTKHRIFDPFFTTKDVGRGTGLGLSITYRILQAHHARVEVQSSPGVGTTFKLAFPLRAAAVEAEQAGLPAES